MGLSGKKFRLKLESGCLFRGALAVIAIAVFVVSYPSASLGMGNMGESAKAAFEQKDYPTALRFWRELAVKGDVDAQLGIAVIYADGLGVTRDYAQAARWFQAAAETRERSSTWPLCTFTAKACRRIMPPRPDCTAQLPSRGMGARSSI
jgi:hypothetical protein